MLLGYFMLYYLSLSLNNFMSMYEHVSIMVDRAWRLGMPRTTRAQNAYENPGEEIGGAQRVQIIMQMQQ